MKILLTGISIVLLLGTFSCDFNPETPDEHSILTDIDGNVYSTIKIGTQEWTAENIRTTKFNDGAPIPHIAEDDVWYEHYESAYCFYGNMTEPDSQKKYGALYNGYAVMTGKLAPEGWHVPTDSDWTILENYLIENGHTPDASTNGKKIAKSLAATTGWVTDSGFGNVGNDLSKNNSSGFNAYPVGWRTGDHGYFGFWGTFGFFWSSTPANTDINALSRFIYARADSIWRGPQTYICGLSVRLIRD